MEQKNEALYLINGDRFLHLRENGAGVGFATYDCALVSRRSSVRFPNRIFLLMVRTPFLPPGTGICLSFPVMTARRFRRSACSTSTPSRSPRPQAAHLG